MSTHVEFTHICSNNFHPFNLNYVTEMLYLLTLSIINILQFFLMVGVKKYFYIPPPLDSPQKIGGGGQYIFIDPHPPIKTFFVCGGCSIYFL